MREEFTLPGSLEYPVRHATDGEFRVGEPVEDTVTEEEEEEDEDEADSAFDEDTDEEDDDAEDDEEDEDAVDEEDERKARGAASVRPWHAAY